MISALLKNISIFIILFSILSSACKKSDPPKDKLAHCDSITTAPKDFLDYWFFRKGSWWVYKLDTSVDIYDTVTCRDTVYSYDLKPEYNYSLEPCINNYDIRYFHQNKSFFPNPNNDPISRELFHTTYNSYYHVWGLTHEANGVGIYPYGHIFYYPFVIGSTTGNAGYNSKLEGFEKLETKYAIYDSALHISNNYIPAQNIAKFFAHIYYVKGIGLVKTVYKNGETWELVDYKIKK